MRGDEGDDLDELSGDFYKYRTVGGVTTTKASQPSSRTSGGVIATQTSHPSLRKKITAPVTKSLQPRSEAIVVVSIAKPCQPAKPSRASPRVGVPASCSKICTCRLNRGMLSQRCNLRHGQHLQERNLSSTCKICILRSRLDRQLENGRDFHSRQSLSRFLLF